MSGPRGSELSHDAIAVGVAGFPLGEVSRRLLQRTILIRQRRLLSRGSVASKKLKALDHRTSGIERSGMGLKKALSCGGQMDWVAQTSIGHSKESHKGPDMNNGNRERLKTPLIRENGRHRAASWDEALDRVAEDRKSVV